MKPEGRNRSVFYTSADGLRLHARLWEPEPAAERFVVCLPGLTRNARDFEGLAAHLSRAENPWNVVAFDYRGRGLSQASEDWRRYAVPVEARDVAAGLDVLGIRRAGFVGTSRGGLILHLLGAARPDLVEAAVLNDVGPELGREGLAQIQAYLSGRRGGFADLNEVVSAQRAIHGEAFPALVEDDWRRFARALTRRDGGRLVADYDPALLRMLDLIDWGKPLPDLWAQFEHLAAVPLMVIRGEHSRLLTAETVAAMQRRHPGLQAVIIEGQGHAPLLDTAGLPERIATFFESAVRRRPT